MTDAQETLLNLLEIEQLEVDLFRGTGQGGETSTRIFGGQVVAQALAAAYGTVPDRLCHSLHAYFIRPGDPEIPVIYQVDRARDGGSFTTRRVVAIQHGKQILNMSASFHVDEPGRHHQHPMPQVSGPENWPDRNVLRAEELDRVPEHRRADFMRPRPIELHDVEPRDMFEPEIVSDENHSWFRMSAAKGSSPQMQHCMLAYASDMNLLGSSLRPHGLTWMNGKVMTASLDHAMWFHAPVHFENWHLYTMDSPWTGGARGFNRGSIYDQNGTLVASTAQEGLIREITPRKP
ncbi:acyl-CoA thioesterase II [Sulfitobacter sp. 20_GPM-1509m]|uniref:acyl-CoA thioesterase n=1 Tax=Sulfitobacter sp. 20_GPM-1509m TaxID=1380367 RepID=UPI00048FC209|nr:acyl-CoA thioesterase II [Sulfitobacter sp. 20_GPM-1509m]|tara:strand:+ start:250 stop:1122 length:873 start_codon:yes stop_codon:yes gene_type:complete